jgi:hypothetical protein
LLARFHSRGFHQLSLGIVSRNRSGTYGTAARDSPFESMTIIALSSREDPMSSNKQTRNLHGNKTEQKLALSRHYRAIGIKAVAAATRKETTTCLEPVTRWR